MSNTAAIILAAGKGTRMKSDQPKALLEIAGKSMADCLLDALINAGINKIVFVGGYKIGMLKSSLRGKDVYVVEQKRLLGSADAVKVAYPALKNFKGIVIVLYVDTPLIKTSTIKRMIRIHKKDKAQMTVLTAVLNDAKEYGRVMRDKKGSACAIVEHADLDNALDNQNLEINVGAYCFSANRLFEGLGAINKNAKKGEYYLTDIVNYFYRKNYRISTCRVKENDEALGVNSRQDLALADKISRNRVIDRIMNSGVTVVDSSNTYISEGVKIGKDTIIYPFSVIEKDVIIGKNCKVGPFANLRRGTILKTGSQVGNYVEVTRSVIGAGSRAKHHSYIGDTLIGKRANIGAGTITANYNGFKKNKTIIGDRAFIGSGTTIVAPVKIGRNAITGAGSVVVKGRDVPAGGVVAGVPARPLLKLKGKGKHI